ncbi:hypothetical protein O0I10_005878, partial [Lichtheimia ornata]
MGWTQSFALKSLYERTQLAALIKTQRINLENIFIDDDHDGVLRASIIKKSQRKKTGRRAPMPANVGWSKIPIWMQHNMYIRTGYRPPLGEHSRCVASLFYMHNETVNFWTHFVALVIFVGIAIKVMLKSYQDWGHGMSIMPFFCTMAFLGCTIMCLTCSCGYHCLASHSKEVSMHWNRLDYLGIIALLVTSYYPTTHYHMYCHPGWQAFYFTIITLAGLLTLSVAVDDRFQSEQYLWIRSLSFLALGILGLVPTFHSTFIFEADVINDLLPIRTLILSGFGYVGGLMIYAYKVPECWFPGCFDIWFASHQIFHVMVFIGMTAFYVAVEHSRSFWLDESNMQICQSL